MGDDGGKGSGRKPQSDPLMDRLRAAAKRAKADPPPPSVAANARKLFGNRKSK